jgi:hypothetical protein
VENGQEGSDPQATGPLTRLYTRFAHAAGAPFRAVGQGYRIVADRVKAGEQVLWGKLKTAFNESSFGRAARWTYNAPPVRAVRDVFNVAGLLYKSPPVKAVRNYVWPFRIWQAVKAQKYIIPVLLAHQLIQTPTVYLFPKAEDYLKDKGVDSAVAKELSDRDIRVRERNFAGTLHSFNDLPTLIGMASQALALSEPAQAYARPDFATRILGQCPVTMPAQDLTARHALAALGNLNETETLDIENIPLTDEQARMAIAFHEFRHCSTENAMVDPSSYASESQVMLAMPNHAESDADANGYKVAARELKNAEIPRAFMYARALNKNAEAHDTALHLDAILNGRKPPKELDALQATEDVFAQLEIYQRMHHAPRSSEVLEIGGIEITIHRNGKVDEAIALEHLVKEHPDMFNAASKRRAELFVEAVKYFFPAKYAAARANTPFPTHIFNMAPTLQLSQ